MQRANFVKLFKQLKRFESICRRSISDQNLFVYADEVEAARKNKQPIVALESTIITHGMPYPDNLNTAIRVEDAVRKKGALPATIAIVNGKIHVGLNQEKLEILSKANPKNTIKCSRRDISTIVSQNLNGGTTVSATMLLANLAEIPIMATGGIGGVHREAELTFDVSTDLTELGRTPVAVVCSGVKSILDIGKTLEYLETQGVPVIKIGETHHFPAFYSIETFDKIKVPHRVSNSEEAAEIIRTQEKLGLKTGMLFAVPIPTQYALDPKEIEIAINKALEKAKSMHISGKYVTPFLLEELNKITSGQSLQANMALIENNANMAAEIAVNLAKKNQNSSFANSADTKRFSKQNPVVIGGSVMDTMLHVKDFEIKNDGRTHAGKRRETCGGVGRNIANALISLGLNGTRLISVVGNDRPGEAIIKSLGDGGQTVERLSELSTAKYTGIVDSKGECCFGVGEMEETFSAIRPAIVRKHLAQLENASFIVLDGNVPPDTMRYVLDLAARSKIPVWYEPTDIQKATKIFEAGSQWENVLHVLSPNKNELLAIGEYFGIEILEENSPMNMENIKNIAEHLAEYIPVVISTLGAQGVLVARRASETDPFYDNEGRLIAHSLVTSRQYLPLSSAPKNSDETFHVSGCGDCLTAGILYGIHKNLDERNCLSLALKAAALSLTSFDTVPATLSMLSDSTR